MTNVRNLKEILFNRNFVDALLSLPISDFWVLSDLCQTFLRVYLPEIRNYRLISGQNFCLTGVRFLKSFYVRPFTTLSKSIIHKKKIVFMGEKIDSLHDENTGFIEENGNIRQTVGSQKKLVLIWFGVTFPKT